MHIIISTCAKTKGNRSSTTVLIIGPATNTSDRTYSIGVYFDEGILKTVIPILVEKTGV